MALVRGQRKVLLAKLVVLGIGRGVVLIMEMCLVIGLGLGFVLIVDMCLVIGLGLGVVLVVDIWEMVIPGQKQTIASESLCWGWGGWAVEKGS